MTDERILLKLLHLDVVYPCLPAAVGSVSVRQAGPSITQQPCEG